MNKDKLDSYLDVGILDEWLCHKSCGEFWSSCECDESQFVTSTPKRARVKSGDVCVFCGVDGVALAPVKNWAFRGADIDPVPTCVVCVTE